ncbi:MAG: hypothetical protein AAFO79_08930, partial [Pseudomonadota bacterium]
MKLLPHRYPFLLLDRLTQMNGEQSAVGIKNVTINENFFQGHFPSFPVHLCQAVEQQKWVAMREQFH